MDQEDNMIKSIEKIVDTYQEFNIPNLQRSYVWTEIEWEQLWEDIHRVYTAIIDNQESQEQHFMGCLVLQKNGTSFYDIIDGQQRFTTLKILMDYLYDLKEYRGELSSNSKNYIQISNINIKIETGIIDELNKSEKEPYTKVYNYYAAKYNMVDDTWDLDLLINIIKKRFFFMVRKLEKDENEHDVFEAINATGKPLQFGDLILNYLCELNEKELKDCDIRNRWDRILNSVYQNELLETAPVIDALKSEEEEEKEGEDAIENENEDLDIDDIEDENEDSDVDDIEEQDMEDLEDSGKAAEPKTQEKKIRENPLKLKKFLNALHCLTLPQTKSMPESIDAFKAIFERLKNSNLGKSEDDEFNANYILSQMEEWLDYYLAYLNPQNYMERKFFCDELYYLSILGNTSIIPVVMRTLKKYNENQKGRRNILYGITCCQIIKNVYFERDNTHEMDKKSILADYLYENVDGDLNKYLCYLVNMEKLIHGLENDWKCLEANPGKYDEIELYKVPYNKKICKFLLAISYDWNAATQTNSNPKKKLIELEKATSDKKENAKKKKIIADYLVSPDEMDEENNPSYLNLGYDGKTVNELWNIVLRDEDGNIIGNIKNCKKTGKSNLDRLKTVLTAIRNYCEDVLKLKQKTVTFEKKFFVKFALENNMFSQVEGCDCKKEDIEDTTDCYFGFEYNKEKDKWYFTTYPKNYFGNNDTIAYFLNGECVGEKSEKEKALLALLEAMKEKVGEEDVKKLVSSMTRKNEDDKNEVSEKPEKLEKPSNLIYITKNILKQYTKEKKIRKSTKKRWETYVNQLNNDDDITVNRNTDVQVISKGVKRIHDEYIKIAEEKEIIDYEIGFWLKMRKPEMHYIKGVRKLTQYRNLADTKMYEDFILYQKSGNQENMDRVETVKNNSVNVSYPTLKQRYFSADSMTIDEILSNYTLKVPEYQRNYVWDKNNWNALIQSIEENEKLNLGSIILYINDKDSAQQPKVASIVDGQQRLTTIFTLLNCLDKDKRDAYQIDKANEDENIKKCKEYMNKYVEDCTNGKFNIGKIISRIKDIKVYVLTINCEDSIYQYRVFSSVNGKGKKLSVEEKVKNYLLKELGGEKKGKINTIASNKGFIKAYSERREMAHIAESKLYGKFKEAFKEAIEKEKNQKKLLNTLDSERNVYVFLKTGNGKITNNDKEENLELIKEFWIWLKLYQHLKVDTADALLLDILCKNISNTDSLMNCSMGTNGKNNEVNKLRKTVELLKQIDMIYFLLYVDDQNGNGKKSINSKFPKLIGMDDIRIRMKVEDKNKDKEEKLILDDPALYNNLDIKNQVDHIWNKIKETDLTRTMRVNVSRYLLMILEIWNGLDRDKAFFMLTNKNSKGITKLANCDVEHIFPANPDKEYENLNHPEYLYMLENVCLLESDINRSKTLSNGMMVMQKQKKKKNDDKVKSKLGYYIEDEKFVCGEAKYSGSKLGFPKMFYENNGMPNEKYVCQIDSKNSTAGFFYSNDGAEERLKNIKTNIDNSGIFLEMLGSVLPEEG